MAGDPEPISLSAEYSGPSIMVSRMASTPMHGTMTHSRRNRVAATPLIFAACTLLWAAPLHAQTNPDQSRQPVMPAHLPDPLVFADGTPVATPAQWPRRRQELLHLFTEQMYGRMPGRPTEMRFHVLDLDRHALGGKATREQISILFRGRENGPRLDLLVYVPNRVKHPPVILGFNFWGNETVHPDPGIRISDRWVESGPTSYLDLSCVKNNRATQACRGIDQAAGRWKRFSMPAMRWPLRIAATWIRTARTATTKAFAAPGPNWPREADNFSTIAAWAWAMSRALDYLEQDRLRRWPACRRIRMVAPGQGGDLGRRHRFAFRRRHQQRVRRRRRQAVPRRARGNRCRCSIRDSLTGSASNFKQYNGRDADLPFDQNEVLALIAPRPLYIASAILDENADPQAEFLGALAVTPVYRFLGSTGLPADTWPSVDQPVLGRVSYHVRSGVHSVTDFDWEQYLRFSDAWVKPGPR